MAPMAPGGGNTRNPPGKRKRDSQSDSDDDGSNGSRISASNKWIITWWKYPENWREYFTGCNKLKKYVAGHEQGEKNGGWHIQGYFESHKKMRPIETLKWPGGPRFKKAKGDEWQNFKYCSKGGDFIYKGIEPPYNIELDFHQWQETLATILREPPNDRDIHWVWEGIGGVGKTNFQKWVYMHMERAVTLCGKAADMKHGIVQYKETNGCLPKIVMINVPRCQDQNYISWQGIEEMKDMFFYSGKYEGGMVCGASPHVIIFANERPDTSKMSNDRWKIWKIVDQELIDDS